MFFELYGDKNGLSLAVFVRNELRRRSETGLPAENIDKNLIGEVKVGEIFGLEVIEVGEQITLKLKKIQGEDTEENNERVKFNEVFKEIDDGLENII